MSERFMTLPEIRRAAKRILPPGPWGYGAGGAETETTLRRNRQALQRLAIRQRVLVDVREVDLTTPFLGLQLPMPVAIAPMGGLVVFHPQGDCEMVRGAGPSGTLSVPLGLKGIMTAEDARLAVEAGVQIVWVSNHGGRQLDHGQATIDVLPEIVEAVAGRAEIIIDGGFSRGTDVIKAVALGAKVVAMGRTVLWGLAVDGAAGVARTLELLREEIATTLALCGQTSMRGLTPALIRHVE